MTDKISVGLIGSGKHGSRYADHIINDLDIFDLTAICRRSKYGINQAEKWNCKYYSHWHDLIADKNVDAVISVTPPYLNQDIAQVCCNHRKNLLLEKPLAIDAAKAREIVKIFHDSDLGLTVGHTLRYNPIIKELKRRLLEFGNIYAINAEQRLEPSTLTWLADKSLAGGGVILHTAVHIFDSLRFITGHEITRIRAMARQIHNPQVEDLFSAQFEMGNNIIGTISASKVGKGRCGSYEFVCNDGQIYGDQVHSNIHLINKEGMKLISVKQEATIIPLLKSWYKFLTKTGVNPISGEDGLWAVKICQACYQSLNTNNWITI